jgi:predicted 2-oxoglutarate/Fe(II)-dependent dioxygenase YbiX
MGKIKLAPGIVLYKNVMSDFYEDIKSLSEFEWKSEYVQNNGSVELDVNTRNTLSIDIPRKTNINDKDEVIRISEKLNKFLGAVELDYCQSHQITLRSYEPYKILKYDVGGKFDLHMDDGGARLKRVSIVFYINDDYEGGELHFENFDVKIKPSAGDMIVFPSSFIYSHLVTEITSGTRYSIASWMR